MLRWTRAWWSAHPRWAGRCGCCPSGAGAGSRRGSATRPPLALFARPYRDVAARLDTLAATADSCSRTRRAGGLPPRVHRRRAHRARPGRVPSTSSPAPRPRRAGGRSRTRASIPSRSTSSPTGWARWQLNPAPILLVHRGPAAVRELVPSGPPPAARCTSTSTTPGSSTGSGRSATPGDLAALGRRARRRAAPDRRRAPPLRRLPAPARGEHPGGPHDRGLAMLVDQDETPLFLGAIHRLLHGVRSTQLAAGAARRARR